MKKTRLIKFKYSNKLKKKFGIFLDWPRMSTQESSYYIKLGTGPFSSNSVHQSYLTFYAIQSVPQKVCQTSGSYYMNNFDYNDDLSPNSRFEPLHRYKPLNVSRYCYDTVWHQLTYAYAHLWGTLLPRNSLIKSTVSRTHNAGGHFEQYLV